MSLTMNNLFSIFLMLFITMTSVEAGLFRKKKEVEPEYSWTLEK